MSRVRVQAERMATLAGNGETLEVAFRGNKIGIAPKASERASLMSPQICGVALSAATCTHQKEPAILST
jgi:hypothetical protein